MLTDFNQLDLNKRYSYADYLTWRFDEMVELIKGRVFKMSPAPSRAHQEVLGALHLQIGHYLHGKSCRVYLAPFDVRLPLPEHKQTPSKIDTVVQPDLCIVCDPAKLDDQGCNGAPDWIIEILSPATSQKDFTDKFEIYRFGRMGYCFLSCCKVSIIHNPHPIIEKTTTLIRLPAPCHQSKSNGGNEIINHFTWIFQCKRIKSPF